VTGITLDLPEHKVREIASLAAEMAAEMVRAASTDAEGFMDVETAAEFLACPTSRIYALVSARRIPFHKDSSRLLFDRRELRDWVHNGGGKRP
jgi:excisionase family DNA binding protein